MDFLHHISFGIGVLGVSVIVLGVLCGLARFLRSEYASLRGVHVDSERRKLRQRLGYYLLLGLEFLIAADIIDTLMTPNSQDLIILGAIVVIRTVISFSLNSELAQEMEVAPAPVAQTFQSAVSPVFQPAERSVSIDSSNPFPRFQSVSASQDRPSSPHSHEASSVAATISYNPFL